MRNPSQSFPVSNRADADLAREIAALTASSLRWAGKGPRVIAHAVATALDAALHPACVYVALVDPESGERATAIDGELSRAGVDAEQWRSLLQSPIERLRVVSHPTQPGKLNV